MRVIEEEKRCLFARADDIRTPSLTLMSSCPENFLLGRR